MNEKKFKKLMIILFRALVMTFIPAMCSFLAEPDTKIINNLCNEGYIKYDIDTIKNFLQVLYILLMAILYFYMELKTSIKIDSDNKKINGLLEQNKEIFQTVFSKLVGNEGEINIRIFVPIKKLFKRKNSYFTIVNHNELGKIGLIKNLSFKILPEEEKEGILGICYNERAIIYDDDVKNNIEMGNYNLNEYQKCKTGKVEYVIACPLYNEENEIIAIVSVDGEQKIHIDQNNKGEITKNVVTLALNLQKNVPELFKTKRRLW